MNMARMRPTAVSDHSILSPELGAKRTCSELGLPYSHEDPVQAPPLSSLPGNALLGEGHPGPSPQTLPPDPQERGGVISPAHAEPSTEGSLSHSSCGTCLPS